MYKNYFFIGKSFIDGNIFLLHNKQKLFRDNEMPKTKSTKNAAYFMFDNPSYKDTFIFKLTDPQKIQEARDILNGNQTDRTHVTGIIVKRPVSYNKPWSFYLKPDSISFFDKSIEVCDASIADVEKHIAEVGGAYLPGNRWCMWKSRLLKELSYSELNMPEPESTLTFFKSLLSWFDDFTKWKKFRDTRQAIKRGDKLFDLSAEKLTKLKLMGPWTFNIYETVVVAIPAQLLTKVLNFFFPYAPPPPVVPETFSKYQKAFFTDWNNLIPSVINFFQPFIFPTILLVTSLIISWACLKQKDSTKEARKRTRNAYLYFNATYSLMPQTTMSLALTMLILSSQRGVKSGSIYLVSIGVFIAGFLYQWYLVNIKIPKLLFQLNGYSPVLTKAFWNRRKIPNYAPWTKYDLSITFLVGTLTWLIFLAYIVLCWFVTYSLVTIKLWLKSPV